MPAYWYSNAAEFFFSDEDKSDSFAVCGSNNLCQRWQRRPRHCDRYRFGYNIFLVRMKLMLPSFFNLKFIFFFLSVVLEFLKTDVLKSLPMTKEIELRHLMLPLPPKENVSLVMLPKISSLPILRILYLMPNDWLDENGPILLYNMTSNTFPLKLLKKLANPISFWILRVEKRYLLQKKFLPWYWQKWRRLLKLTLESQLLMPLLLSQL